MNYEINFDLTNKQLARMSLNNSFRSQFVIVLFIITKLAGIVNFIVAFGNPTNIVIGIVSFFLVEILYLIQYISYSRRYLNKYGGVIPISYKLTDDTFVYSVSNKHLELKWVEISAIYIGKSLISFYTDKTVNLKLFKLKEKKDIFFELNEYILKICESKAIKLLN